MDDPVGEAAVHHTGEFRQLYAVTVKVNSARRTMKSKIENAVVSLAEEIEIVLKLLAGIACQVAKLRLHGLRDQLERRQDVEFVLDMAIPHRFETGNISLSVPHFKRSGSIKTATVKVMNKITLTRAFVVKKAAFIRLRSLAETSVCW